MVYNTYTRTVSTIHKNDLDDIAVKNIQAVRNYKNGRIVNKLNANSLIVLYKTGNSNYVISNMHGELSVVSLEYIKINRDRFKGVKFVGKGISIEDEKLTVASKETLNFCKILNFNNKIRMLGGLSLTFELDGDDVTVTGIETEDTHGRAIIPDFVTKISSVAFRNTNISELIVGKNVYIIGCGAFYNCINLHTVKLGDSVRVIENSAFFRCNKLENIEFNHKLTSIGSNAFFMTKIRTITIEGDLGTLENDALSHMTELEYLNLKETKVSNFTGFNNTEPSVMILPKGLKSLDIGTLRHCNKITVLDIPNSVESFYGIYGKQEYNLREALKEFVAKQEFDKINILNIRKVYNG